MKRNLKPVLKEIEEGKLKNALLLLNDIISKDRNNYDAHIIRAKVKRELKDFNGALKDYNRLSDLYPDRVEVFNNRAKLFYLMRSYEKALQDINYANVLFPECVLILFNKGKIECKMNLYKEALESLNSVIKLDPSILPVYFKRGLLKEKTGDYTGALNDYSYIIKYNKKCLTAYYQRGRLLINFMNDEINGKKDLIIVNNFVSNNTDIQNSNPINYHSVNTI